MTTNIDYLAKRWYTLSIKTEEVLPMWYVVEAYSKYGRWYYVKGYRTKVSAVKLADRINKAVTLRVTKYSSVYEREHDPSEGKIIYERGEA